MNLAIFFVAAMFVMFVVVILFIVMHQKSFRNGAVLLVQNGDDPNNSVIVYDKFKIRVNPQTGYREAVFKKKRMATTEPTGKFKFWNWKKKLDDYYTVELRTKQDATKAMTQGAIWFVTHEGNFHPVRIEVPRDEEGRIRLTVIDEENKSYMYDSIRKVKEFKTSDKDKMMQAILMGGTVVIVAAILIFTLVYTNNSLAENIATICREVGSQVTNSGLVDQVQGVVGA